jgi:hypothetical protein
MVLPNFGFVSLAIHKFISKSGAPSLFFISFVSQSALTAKS